MSTPGRRESGSRAPAVAAGALLVLLALVLNSWTLAALFSPDGRFESVAIRMLIVAMQAVLLAAGAILLVRRPMISGRDVLGTIIGWILLALGAEALIRVAYRQDDLWFTTMRRSDALGWETREHFRITRDMGPYGAVVYSTGRHGMRRDGEPSGGRRPRVLVIGDSYTEAAQVSDGGTYFDYLADSAGLDIEVFAYGASAYGSLQEYLLVDRLIDEIAPDLIVWQLCSNDLINNYRPLEARSLFENSGWRRPYLENGEIRTRAPSTRLLSQVSRLAQLVEVRRLMVRASRVAAGTSSERSIEDMLSPSHPLVREAVAVTEEIVRMMRARAGATPVVAFSVDRPAWLGDAFERIAERSGIQFITGVPEAVAARKAAGIQVDGIVDAHWNARGHGIVGRLLADSLTARGLLGAGARLRTLPGVASVGSS